MAGLLGMDFIGSLLAAALTVMVLSYIIGDNPLFRLATHIFIGVAAGYAGTIAWHNVLKPSLIDPLLQGGLSNLIGAEFFTGAMGRLIIGAWLLIAMLLLKLSPSTARWGTLPMVIMVAVGAAVVMGGAITGTLIPQASAAVDTLNPTAVNPQVGERGIERLLNALIMLAGTITTFAYFQFTAKMTSNGEGVRSGLMKVIATVGMVFIAITFGTMYAGALSATIITLSERVGFLVTWVTNLLSGF